MGIVGIFTLQSVKVYAAQHQVKQINKNITNMNKTRIINFRAGNDLFNSSRKLFVPKSLEIEGVGIGIYSKTRRFNWVQ